MRVAVVLMAIFIVVNFLGVRSLAHTNSAVTWWKIFVPLLTIIVVRVDALPRRQLRRSRRLRAVRRQGRARRRQHRGIIFALLGFEQATSSPVRAATRSGTSRGPSSARSLIGAVIYLLLQIVFIGALPSPRSRTAGRSSDLRRRSRAVRRPGHRGRPRLAGHDPVHRRGHLPRRHRPDLRHLHLPDLLRPVAATATCRNSSRAPTARGVPWFGLIFTFIIGLILFLPFPSWQQLVSFITSASVLMYAGAPLAFGVAAQADCRTRSDRSGCRAGTAVAPLAFVIASLIIYWSGWPTLLAARRRDRPRLHPDRAHTPGTLNKHLPNAPGWTGRPRQWLPVYLIGMGVISWQGAFGASAAAISIRSSSTPSEFAAFGLTEVHVGDARRSARAVARGTSARLLASRYGGVNEGAGGWAANCSHARGEIAQG